MFNTEVIVKDMKGGKEDMSEKRFSVKKSGSGLFYRDGDYEIDNTIQFIIETVEMKLNQLSDENEQLKKENYELHKRLGDFEQFEEHIKERTSKTFVKKRCNEYWEEAGLNNDYFE